MNFLARLLCSNHWQKLCFTWRRTLKKVTTRDLAMETDVKIGRDVRIETRRSLAGTSSIEVGLACVIEDYARLEAWGGKIKIGREVFIGPFSVIYGHGGVEIGDRALISMHCRILSSNHSIPELGVPIRSQPDKLLPTQIGQDVWLGAGTTILGGVTIGNGCVVGAGSVVTKDLPPGAIAAGVPARIKKWRSGSTPLHQL